MPRKVERWPRARDTPLQRREHVARSYRDALARVNPGEAARLDDLFIGWGQTWVGRARPARHDDELLTVPELAEHCGVSPRTVDDWRLRGGLEWVRTPDGVRIRFGAATRWLDHRRGR